MHKNGGEKGCYTSKELQLREQIRKQKLIDELREAQRVQDELDAQDPELVKLKEE